jgi:hypothetical protein
MYASAQSLDLTRGMTAPRPKGQPVGCPISQCCEIALDLANPAAAGLDWKLTLVPIRKRLIHGWALDSCESFALTPFKISGEMFLDVTTRDRHLFGNSVCLPGADVI